MIMRLVKANSLLIAIVMLGAAFRLWGINFGLPGLFKYDEIKFVESALRFGSTFDFNPRAFIHGSLLTYVLFFEYALLYIILLLLKLVVSPADFLLKYFIADPTLLFLIGRSTQAFLGLGTIVITYLIAKTLFNRATGLISAYLLSISFIHIQNSHYIKADILSCFLLMLAFLFAARAFRARLHGDAVRSGLKNLLLSGLFMGLAASAKYYALAGCVFLITLQLLTKPRIDREFLLVSLMVPAGFLIGQPYALLAGKKFITDFIINSRAANFDCIYRYAGQSRLLFYFGDMLRNSVGLPVLICSFLSIYLVFKKGLIKSLLFVLSFPVAYSFFIIYSSSTVDRYMVPIAPFLAILAAVVIDYFANKLRPHQTRKFLAVSILLVSLPLVNVIRYSLLLSAADTRNMAKKWIEKNIPSNSTIAMEGAPIKCQRLITLGPDIKSNRETLSNEYRETRDHGGTGFLIQQRIKYLQDSPGQITYRLHKELILTEEAIRRAQPDYVILCGYFDFFRVPLSSSLLSTEKHRLLYKKVEDKYRRIKEFMPFPNLKWDYHFQVDYKALEKIPLFKKPQPIISGPPIYIYEKRWINE